jgi:predicted metal-dependent peptidase
MDAQLKVSRAVTRLACTNPFFGSCLMQLGTIEDPNCATMATDGEAIYWGRDFVDTLTEEEVRGVLCHEVMHVILMHCQKQPARYSDFKLTNVAMDYTINPELRNSGHVLPKGVLFDESGKTAGWTWQAIYLLLEEVKQQQEGEGQPSEGGEDGEGLDGFTASEIEAMANDIANAEDHVGPSKKSDSETETTKQKIQDMVVKAVTTAEGSKTDLPAGMERILEEIREPKLPWNEIFQNLVRAKFQDDFTYRKPNKKFFADDLYLPTMSGERAGTIVLSLDTSGSVRDEELTAYCGEVNCVVNDLKPEKVYLMTSDCRVAQVQEFEGDMWFDVADFKALGGGGTSFRPVFEYLDEKEIAVDQLIYFTDMGVYPSDYPTKHPDFPVIFVSTEPNQTAPFGDVIYLEL